MDKAELQALLEAEVPFILGNPELREFLKGQQKLISYLATALANQGRAVLEMRSQLVDVEQTLAFDDDPNDNALIGITPPKIIGVPN